MAKLGSLKLYLIIGLAIVIFLPPFAKYAEMRYKSKKLEERIASLESDNRKLEDEKMRLETDITYVEEKARERMGMVRKGEIVLKESPAGKK